MNKCPKCSSKWITKIYLEAEKKLKNICLTCNNVVYEAKVSDLDKKQFIKEN